MEHNFLSSKELISLDFTGKEVVLDIETYPSISPRGEVGGLVPAASSIGLLQLYVDEKTFLYKGQFIKATVENLLENLTKAKKVIGHNIQFDLAHLCYISGSTEFLTRMNLADTQIMYHTIATSVVPDGDPKGNLKHVVKMLFDFDLPKELQLSDWGKEVLDDAQLEYATNDVIWTFKVYKHLEHVAEKENLENILNLESTLIPAVVSITLQGFTIDIEEHNKCSELWGKEAFEVERECVNFLNSELDYDNLPLLEGVKNLNLIKEVLDNNLELPSCGLGLLEIVNTLELIKSSTECRKSKAAFNKIIKNVNDILLLPSKKGKVGNWLEERLSEEDLKAWPRTTKTKALSVGKEAFLNFDHVPEVEPLARFAEYSKLDSTYGRGLKDYIIQDKLYSSYTQGYTLTGRLSSRNPNSQNFPTRGAGKELRKVFIAGEGKSLVVADYNQIELRIAGLISQDLTMLKAYDYGLDLHTITARNISGKDIPSKEDRTAAKIVNFSLVYGSGADSLVAYAWQLYRVIFTLEQAKEYIRIFRETYFRYREWQLEVSEAANISLKTTTILGKHRTLSADKYYTTSMNHPIQGAASEVIKLALILLNKLVVGNDGINLVTTVHDEIVMEVEDDSIELGKAVLQHNMEEAMVKVFENAALKNLVDIKVCKNWLEAKG